MAQRLGWRRKDRVEPPHVGERERKLNIESVTWGKLTWINIEKPTSKETEYLGQNYPFHPLDLEDCLSRIERPKIDEYEDYLFIVLHFPVFDRAARVTRPSQVALFLGEDYLISLHSGELRPLANLFNDCQANESARQENMGRSPGYLFYRIFDRLVDYCFPIMNKIISNIEAVEDDAFTKPVPHTVREILITRRDMISFRRIIRSIISVLDSLQEGERPILKEEDTEIYFGDIDDHAHKILETIEDYEEVIDSLSDTSNWLTSHRIQEVMRMLAIVATVLTPAVVISSVYGMNIELPFQHSPFAFGIITSFTVSFVVAMLLFFRSRRWI